MNNRKSGITGFVLLIFCYSISIFPQQASDTLVYTLDEAINKALVNNWDVKIAQKEIEKAQEQIDEAYSNAFPRLEFAGQYIRNIKLPVLFIPPNTAFNPSNQTQTFELGSSNSFSATFTLSQVLYSQKVNTAIKIAGEYSDYSKEGDNATKAEIILSVKKAFYTILLAKELVNVSKQNYDAAKANFENVASLYKQGVASEYDYLRSEVQVANIQPMYIQAENNLALAKSSLKNLIAVDIDKPIDVKGKFVFEELSPEYIEEQSRDAVQNNPLVKQLKIQESLLTKNIDIEKADYFPTLSFFGQYQFQTQDNTFKVKDYLWAKSFMVGLQLSYTLFDGFGRGARVEQAKIDKDKVELGKRKLEEGIKVQILQSELKMDEAAKRIKAQGKSLEQAQKALKIAETRYKSGVGTQLEIIDTQAALTFAQTNYSQSVYDYLIAASVWEYVISMNK